MPIHSGNKDNVAMTQWLVVSVPESHAELVREAV